MQEIDEATPAELNTNASRGKFAVVKRGEEKGRSKKEGETSSLLLPKRLDGKSVATYF